jgi:hypothetical protein
MSGDINANYAKKRMLRINFYKIRGIGLFEIFALKRVNDVR